MRTNGQEHPSGTLSESSSQRSVILHDLGVSFEDAGFLLQLVHKFVPETEQDAIAEQALEHMRALAEMLEAAITKNRDKLDDLAAGARQNYLARARAAFPEDAFLLASEDLIEYAWPHLPAEPNDRLDRVIDLELEDLHRHLTGRRRLTPGNPRL